MKKKEKIWERELFMYYATITSELAPAYGSRKISGISLFWQAYYGFLGPEPIHIHFKEGTYGLATWFPQLIVVSI